MPMILDLFKRKNTSIDPASLEILNQATLQRAKMDMVFDAKVTSIKGLSCALNNVGESSLTLEVYGLEKIGAFEGRSVACFFRIREGKSVGFFGFTTRIDRVYTGKSGAIFFTAAMPQRVDRSQRRRSLRVHPDMSWLEDIVIWDGIGHATLEEAQIVAESEAFKKKGCRVENISAGGIGLYFPRAFCRNTGLCPMLGNAYTVHLLFTQEMRNQPMGVWFESKAVRVVDDPISRDQRLGLEFIRVASKQGQGGGLSWKLIEDNVSDELMERVFSWHTFLLRERGQTE